MRSTGKKYYRIGPFRAVLASLIFLIAVSLVIASALSEAGGGQIPYEGNNYADNDYDDATYMGGPIVAISWIPSSDITISRIEIFTGEKVGTNALALWSDDGGIPQSALGYTQPFTSVLANSWQGAYLNTPVSVISGNRYWIVWDPEDGQQVSASPHEGIQQTYWGSSGGTVSGEVAWSGQYSSYRWKFRVFCAKPGIPVDIDIKPGSFPNSINLGSSGNIPVAIFSSAAFDATTVDPTLITLADAMVCVKGKGTPMYSLQDANGDGIMDMIVHMETSGLKLTDGDTTAQLKGYTNDRTPISGEDSVRVIQG